MNRCYLCQSEAVSRCYTCGQLICAKHGRENCHRCDTAVVSGDPRPRQTSAEPLKGKEPNHGWWRPQQAEEYVPPACYECKALARAVCRNCQSHFCREHAGRGGLCQECGRSARLGLVVFILSLVMIAMVLLLGGLIR